ncbi:hypothetical protein SVAN01_01938 [Stagonosporopsis vannaccii]|nr:hypothetical protein SVAN01_01938 [Stagonosporopsis vannaccii]
MLLRYESRVHNAAPVLKTVPQPGTRHDTVSAATMLAYTRRNELGVDCPGLAVELMMMIAYATTVRGFRRSFDGHPPACSDTHVGRPSHRGPCRQSAAQQTSFLLPITARLALSSPVAALSVTAELALRQVHSRTDLQRGGPVPAFRLRHTHLGSSYPRPTSFQHPLTALQTPLVSIG